MKREALTHTKMKRLCRSLDIQLYAAVGIMESIWNLAAKESPQGDIGKLSNQDISDAIAWNGSEEKLVEALINAKWFDKDPTYRLIVHDWHEHCDDSVHMRLARIGLLFANGTKPKTTRLSMAERELSPLPSLRNRRSFAGRKKRCECAFKFFPKRQSPRTHGTATRCLLDLGACRLPAAPQAEKPARHALDPQAEIRQPTRRPEAAR
jgi:hypothetical protein